VKIRAGVALSFPQWAIRRRSSAAGYAGFGLFGRAA